MYLLYSLILILIIILVGYIGAGLLGCHTLFGIIAPYFALGVFIAGFIYRIVLWARSPVPFHIPTVCGQQRSLPWIRSDNKESPHTTWGVVSRMALEVLFFRSLFRNDRAEIRQPQRLLYGGNRWLWLGAMVFHWSLLIILMRHLRFFIEPVPGCITFLQDIDGFFQWPLPSFYVTDILIVVALLYLFGRRLLNPQVRHISLLSDYFALLLIGSIAVTGILMRHFYKVDLMEIKRFALGILAFNPVAPEGIGTIFYIHLFLVSVLLVYFPFSKLMHAGGVFLSPTRNLMNNSRMVRHVNPWDYPVKVHTYEEYEDEFRTAMKEAGIPVEKNE
ncbi:MAG: sulfate reduction electron transfer complex DsrMKJOP subunit DsrM [Syntrophorhabdaceae bacterium]|nr:sulfate reduction electron transfer complex DsrMKJOP subunit DsrM [Syntrophorhabdaceae bacterium]MDD5244680.1 sulfate reduction electron transfer complex DsrMKJOP subunit DsrM [Syntrophorhabdaceae bacterium]